MSDGLRAKFTLELDDRLTTAARNALGGFVKQTELVTQGTGRGRDALGRYRKGLDNVERGADETEREVRTLADAVRKLNGDLAKGGKSKPFEFAANLKHSADAVEGFSRQVGGLIQGPIDKFVDFEEQMSKVRSLTFKGAQTEEAKRNFTELSAVARKLGADTQFSGSEAAGGMIELATAGFEAREQIAAMPGLLNISAASGDSIAEAAAIASTALRTYGLEAEKTGTVGDVLVNTFTSTKTTLTGLGESLKHVGPVAAAAGISIEKTAAMVGALGQAGIEGSQAGTALRGLLLRMQAPSREAKSALRSLGLDPKQLAQEIAAGNPEQVFAQLQAAMDKKFGEGQQKERRAKIMKAVAGEEAVAGGNVLLESAGSGQLQALIASNEGAAGVAERIAADMVNNTAGSKKELESALEELQLTIGERLVPDLVDALKWIREVTLGITDWAAEHPDLVRGIGLVLGGIAGFGLVVAPILKAAAAISTVATAIKAVAVFVVANPIVAAITAVAVSALLIYKYWDPITDFFSNLWDTVTAAFKVSIEWIIGKIEWALDKVGYIKDALTGRDYDSEIEEGTAQAEDLKRSSSLFADDVDDRSLHAPAPVRATPTAMEGLIAAAAGGLREQVGAMASAGAGPAGRGVVDVRVSDDRVRAEARDTDATFGLRVARGSAL